MANSSVPITAGSGTEIDTRTTTTDTNHRQVIVIGDPATDAGVAPVDATSGLKVNLGADNDVTVTSGAITETNSTAILADTASMDTNLTTLAGAVTGTEMQVDVVTSALPSGAATSAAQLPDGHNVTIDNSTGAAAVNIQDGGNTITVDGTVTATPAATGTGTESGVQRVTIATDSTGLLSIDDNGGSLTVDNGGTFAVQADTTLQAETTKVIGTVNVAAAQTIAVTNAGTFATQATLQTGSAAIGKLAANSGVDIGDVDVTSIANGSINGPAAPTIDSYTNIAINLAAAANQVLVSSAASKQIWVYSVAYTCSAAGTVSFQDEDDVAVTGIMDHTANSGIAIPATGNFAMPIWKLATDKDLEVDVTSASIDGWLSYAIVSV